MSVYDYDLFVIGGGSGGVRAARLAGNMGKRVALAEEHRVGGTCVIRGCVPKKIFSYASSYSENFSDSRQFGWKIASPQFDWKKLVAAKNIEIFRLEQFYRKGLENARVRIYKSRAFFVDAHTLELQTTGEKVTAAKILIATGSRPNCFSFPGRELCISSNEIFDLVTLPESIVIVGGGYIAVEFASIFCGFGVSVTLVYRGKKILRRFDRDLRHLLQNALRKKGIRIICNEQVVKVEKIENHLTVFLAQGERLKADHVMLALGRSPNTDDLFLKKAGISTDMTGAVCVDDFMQTNIPHISAIGDVRNHIQLTPVAVHEAVCFIKTAFENIPTVPDHDLVATAVFSRPEIGTVGLSEEEAVKKRSYVEIYRTLFRPMRNTITGRNEQMLIKLVVDGETRQILGSHILGPEAGEMIQLLSIAMKGGVSKEIFDATMAVHPTAAEELVTMYKPNFIYRNGKRENI